jgi:hypothetical protein
MEALKSSMNRIVKDFWLGMRRIIVLIHEARMPAHWNAQADDGIQS